MNVVSISIPAWAKLRMRVARQINTRLSAAAAPDALAADETLRHAYLGF